MISPPKIDFSDVGTEDIVIDTIDGSGDRLTGKRHVARSCEDRQTPTTVVLLHGFLGDLDRMYMRILSRYYVDQGYAVVRMNSRGAGSSRHFCTRTCHGGVTTDLRAIARALSTRKDTGKIAWIGISMGGDMVLNAACEAAFLSEADHLAVVSVSAPFDHVATAAHVARLRNWPYSRYVVKMIREKMSGRPGLTSDQAAHLKKIRSLDEFYETFMAPEHGYSSAHEFYIDNSPKRCILEAKLPCLVITAKDDPWIAPQPYLAMAWSRNPLLTPAITTTGGHVGFHACSEEMPMYALWSRSFIEGQD